MEVQQKFAHQWEYLTLNFFTCVNVYFFIEHRGIIFSQIASH